MHPDRRSDSGPDRGRAAAAAVLVAGSVAGLLAGSALATGGHDALKGIAAAVALVCGTLLALLAARRFPSFLVVLFAIRPVLDALKNGGNDTSNFTPGVAVGLVFLLTASLWLVARHREGRLEPLGRPSWAMLALVGAALLSVLASRQPVISLEATLKLASGLVMFLVLEQVALTDPRRLRTLYVAMVGTTLFSSLVAIAEGLVRSSSTGRVRGLFVHENDLAEFTVTVALLMLALRPHLAGRLRTLTTVTFALALPALYFTFARGAWISFALGLLIVGFLQNKKMMAGVLVLGVAVVLFVPGVSHRFSDLGDKRVQGAGDPNSFAFRERYWGEIAPFANSTPIVGIGLDMVEHSTPEGLLPHNTPLEVWIETGAVGSLAFLGLVGTTVVALRRAVRGLPPGLARGWAVGAVAAASAFFVQALTDNLLLQALQLWYLALAVAPPLALHAARVRADAGQAAATVPAARTADDADRGVLERV